MNVVTVEQAIADGTTPAALMYVAKLASGREAKQLRRVAQEVAERTGYPFRRASKPANDNRPQKKRRAA